MGEYEKSNRFYCAKQRQQKRICQFLKLQEAFSVYDFSEESPYTESILSREVKGYFTESVLEEEILLDEGECLLQRIYSLFPLDAFEQMCVEFVVLGEINPYFEKFYIYMNNDWNSGYLTLDTAIKLYTMDYETNASYYRYFLKGSRLLNYFFSLDRQAGKARGRWGLKCRESFFRLLVSEQSRLCEEYPFIACPDEKAEWDDGYGDCYQQLDTVIGQKPAGIYLYGEGISGKRKALEAYGRKNGHMVYFFDIQGLLFLLEKNLMNEELENLCRDIRLHQLVQNAWLCMYFIDEALLENEAARRLIIRLFECFLKKDSVLFLLGEKPLNLLKQYPEVWEISCNDYDMQKSNGIWRKLEEKYCIERDSGIEFFVQNCCLTPAQITRIFQNAEKRRILGKKDCIQWADVKAECRKETRCDGNNQITVMDTGYTWNDLVLPGRQKEQLRDACNRIRYSNQIYHTWGFDKKVPYGRGVSMVFTGPPGTGKTMSASIIADELKTSLYRVDLAAIVSKYIGETEKNLNAVFDAVKKGQGVLFFDEADVLFGKRTNVKASNDKHSNMETAYLLQKMEEYEGIVVLATNYMNNIDEAFKRRIQYFIEFSFPDEDCRRQLWRNVFPVQTEFEATPDYEFLAKNFELSGSNIKNIAVQAAFYAADEKRGVNMGHIIKALQTETEKMGKRISREELQEYCVYL